jgi:hypothetical protein
MANTWRPSDRRPCGCGRAQSTGKTFIIENIVALQQYRHGRRRAFRWLHFPATNAYSVNPGLYNKLPYDASIFVGVERTRPAQHIRGETEPPAKTGGIRRAGARHPDKFNVRRCRSHDADRRDAAAREATHA